MNTLESSSTMREKEKTIHQNIEVPKILQSEVRSALTKMKRNKVVGLCLFYLIYNKAIQLIHQKSDLSIHKL